MTPPRKLPSIEPASWLARLFERPWRKAVGFIALTGLGLTLFLLFRPSSDIRTLPLPSWRIFRWIDEHGELRNVPAFALFTVPFMLLARGRHERRRVGAAIAIFIAATEFCQLAIPSRFFEFTDIASGWLGLAFTWGLLELIAWPARRKRAFQQARRPLLVRTGISRKRPAPGRKEAA